MSDFCLGVRTKLRQEQSQGEPVIGLSDLFQTEDGPRQKGIGGVTSEVF